MVARIPVRARGAGPLDPRIAADLAPPAEKPKADGFLDQVATAVMRPGQPDRVRLLPAILAEMQAGKRDISSAELASVIQSLELGQVEDTDTLRRTLAPALTAGGLDAIDEAIAVRKLSQQMHGRDNPFLPGGPGVDAFLESLAREATLNLADPRQGFDSRTRRALTLAELERRQAHPVAEIGGAGVGGSLPFVAGVRLLRALRAARGLSPVGPGASGTIEEGARVGGPLMFIRKPEGAEDMTAAEEIVARGTQAAAGVAAGVLLDFTVVKAGEFLGRFATAVRDKRTAAALAGEARSKGFDSVEEYVGSLIEFMPSKDGFVVRPRRTALDLPAPEAADTIEAQLEAFAAGRKPGVLITPGERLPESLPEGARTAEVPGRGTLIYKEDATLAAALEGRMGEALGLGTAEKPGGDTVVTARDAKGRVVSDILTDGRKEVDDAAAKLAGDGGTVETRQADAALRERTLRAQASEYDRLARATSDPAIRQELLRKGAVARTEAAGRKPILSPSQRFERAMRIDPDKDDVITAIRKLGGIDTDIETDWAGRLSHLPRPKIWGIPAIERPGNGLTLDDLTEKLMELGYLPRSDVGGGVDQRLLAEMLDEAETGKKVYGFSREVPEDQIRRMMEQDMDRPTDGDFTVEPGPVDPKAVDRDYTIDTETGTIVPARAMSEEDLIRLREEELHAERFFEAEGDEGRPAGSAEQSGRPGDTGAAGLPERLAGEPAGRPRAESEPADSFRLRNYSPAELRAEADRLERLEAERAAGEQRAQDKVQADTEVQDFRLRGSTRAADADTRQGDIADAVHRAPKAEDPGGAGAGETGRLSARSGAGMDQPVAATGKPGASPKVEHVEVGSIPSGLRRVSNAGDVAHATAAIRKQGNENFLAVVTDADGNILRVSRHSIGGRNEAQVDPALAAGVAHRVPGAKQVWFVHNHPNDTPRLSDADKQLADHLHELLRDTGIEPRGIIALGGKGSFAHYHPDPAAPQQAAPRLIKPGVRDEALPVTERQYRRLGVADRERLIDDATTHAYLERTAENDEGVLLLDTSERPLAFVKMSQADMLKLRQGEGAGAAALLRAIDETNATSMTARIQSPRPEDMEAVARNLGRFGAQSQTQLRNVINWDGVSSASIGADTSGKGVATFYANPFVLAVAETARDIGIAPGRNVAAGFAGGTAAGVSSEEEAGSAKWWLDVAAGAGAGVGLSQFLRRTQLLGKGSIVDNWREHAVQWIDSLPLIGRGPVEVRSLKSKQRAMRDILDRQTEAIGKHLLKTFSPAERAMMADLIERRGIVRDMNMIHRQAAELDDYLVHVAERMKELGMLPADLQTGGYLHRYYAKHLGLDAEFREAKKQSMSGSYSIARGTEHAFERDYFSPGSGALVDEFAAVSAELRKLEKRTGDMLEADTAARIAELRARRKELSDIELREFVGEQEGRVRSFIFAGDEVGRVESGKDPILARLGQTTQPIKDGKTLNVAAGVENLAPTDRVWTIRGTKGKEALLHRDWTEAERTAWGEIKDAGYRYVRGMAEASHDLALATMFNTVARNSDWVSDSLRTTAKGKDWVQVPSTKVNSRSPLRKYGALSGKYVRPDVWGAIQHYGRRLPVLGPIGDLPVPGTGGIKIEDVYRGFLSKWKLYKTVYNPVTHLNNTFSNVEMLYQAGYAPADLARAILTMAEGERNALWREARDQGIFGTDWGTSVLTPDEGGGTRMLSDLAEELRKQPEIPDAIQSVSAVMRLKDWWIGTSNAVRGAQGWRTGVEVAKAMGKPAMKGAAFLKKPIDVAARAMQRAYRFEDEMFKMAVFSAERQAGKSAEEAARTAQQFFFDYRDLPDALRFVRDFPVGAPFISYPYFALQAVARNATQNPERLLALIAGYEAFNYQAMTAEGLAPGEYWAAAEADDELAPPWDQGRSLWGARNTVRLPFLEGYKLALGRAHALGNPFMTEAGGREKLPAPPYVANFWGSSLMGGNPLHALLDVAVNEDWKGKKIYEPGDPDDEKAAKAAAYLYQAWTPSNILIPGSYHQERFLEGAANDVRKAQDEGRAPPLLAPVVDAANGVADALGLEQLTGEDRVENEIVTRDALLASFGIKLRPIRHGESLSFELDRLDREIGDVEQSTNKQARLKSEKRITKEKFRERRDAREQSIDELLEKQRKLKAGRKTLRELGLFRK